MRPTSTQLRDIGVVASVPGAVVIGSAAVAVYQQMNEPGVAGGQLFYPLAAVFVVLAVLVVSSLFGRFVRGLLVVDICIAVIAVGGFLQQLEPGRQCCYLPDLARAGAAMVLSIVPIVFLSLGVQRSDRPITAREAVPVVAWIALITWMTWGLAYAQGTMRIVIVAGGLLGLAGLIVLRARGYRGHVQPDTRNQS